MIRKTWFGFFTLAMLAFTMFWALEKMGKIGEEINNPSPDAVLTDTRMGYTPDELYTYFEELGIQGRVIVRNMYLYEDLVFPFVYGGFLCCLLLYLASRSFPGNKQILWLAIFPWISVAIDFWENYLSVRLIDAYPVRMDSVAKLASTVTIVKWISCGVLMVMIVILGIAFLVKKFRKKSTRNF